MRTIRPDMQGNFPFLFEHTNYFSGDVALGNCTQWHFYILRHRKSLALAIQGNTIHVWGLTGVMPLQLKNVYCIRHSDAKHLADFINQQLQCEGHLKYGTYGVPYCYHEPCHHEHYDGCPP